MTVSQPFPQASSASAVDEPGPLSRSPLVSVVTPVYNGAAHLAECVESVLSQTYENWEYVIVDNCSSDQTVAIARGYVARDDRVRVVTNDEFLDIIQNWNRALRQISPDSVYCKVLHADDVMVPVCLERMVALAVARPSVAIVSAYRLNGMEVDLDGVIPFGTDVVPGREVCRLALLGRGYVFGTPSSLLVRTDLIRARHAFYNEENYHSDTEVCFELLQSADLGFVHQVLTHTRLHPDSVSSTTGGKLNTYITGWLRTTTKFGPVYLTADEYEERLAWLVRRYLWSLAKALVRGRFRDARYRSHHIATLRMLRQSVTLTQVSRGLALAIRPPRGRRPPRSESVR